MRTQERPNVKILPPAVQDEAAGPATHLLPTVSKGHLVTEAAATQMDILIVIG